MSHGAQWSSSHVHRPSGVDQVDHVQVDVPGCLHPGDSDYVGDDLGLWRSLQHRFEVADVIGVVVRDPDPTDFVGGDDRLQRAHELVSLNSHAGVHQHRLLRVQDVGVDPEIPEALHGQGQVRGQDGGVTIHLKWFVHDCVSPEI